MPSAAALMHAFGIVVFMISYLSVGLLLIIAKTRNFQDNVAAGLSAIAIGLVIALSNLYETAFSVEHGDKVLSFVHGLLAALGVLIIVGGLIDLFSARKKAASEQASHGPN